jgi:hypothetical protein
MCCKNGKKCVCCLITKILVIIGGINWGLIGVGVLFKSLKSWNVVGLVFGSMPVIEAIIYVLVGIAAVSMLFCCHCKKCAGGCCQTEDTPVASSTQS